MPSLRRANKKPRPEKHKPEVVTGNFELHYEDVVQNNRLPVVAIFAVGLVLLAAFIPGAVNRSKAELEHVSVELEQGIIVNPELVTKVEGDVTASEDGYIEFRLLPTQQDP
jgi:hypothetical protein